VYRPDEGRPAPAILIRTPYNKGARAESAASAEATAPKPFVRAAVERGYAVVVQDVRGRHESGGVFDPYRQEGRDGFDSVEWTATQSWCNGRVAGSGLSYPGAVQWLAAVEAPPHLVCIFPAMCFSSARHFFYFGGAFDLSWIPWIANNIAPEERRRHDAHVAQTGRDARAEWGRIADSVYRHLPLNDLPLLKEVAPYYFEWLDHPDDGPYWEFADIEGRHDRVTVPAMNFSGWHDEGYGPVGAIRNFTGMRKRGATAAARDPHLIIGPWTHGEPDLSSTRVGDRDFGASAGLDYERLVLDWCDLHARGIDRGLSREPRVRVFVMGSNQWRTSSEWPLAGTTLRPLHLRSGGRLSWQPAAKDEPPDRYRYDPADPVVDPYFNKGLGPHDQRQLESRKDVVVFTSEPLDEDLDVIGQLECRVWLASSAPDTDVIVRVLDVEPDGPAWNLMSPTIEVLRVRYRAGERNPMMLLPGVPVEARLTLPVCANRFLRGHRIRVHITSSFFPHLDRNPNTGRPVSAESRLVPATNTIYHDAARPSRIILPVVAD
jgi:putative CocE/NonD family hydrolase